MKISGFIIAKNLKLGILLKFSIKLLVIAKVICSLNSKYSKFGNSIDEFLENKGKYISKFVEIISLKIFNELKDFIGIYKL